MMTTMTMTILMPKRERKTDDPKRVNQTCTEVVLPGVWTTDLELGEALTHGWQNPVGKIRRAKSGLRILGSENHSSTEDKIWGQNPDYGFWIRKTTHPRGTKSGRQNPVDKIPATDFGFGNSLTHEGQNLGGKNRWAKSGRQNPSYGFWTRKIIHSRWAKSGRQNPSYRFWTRKIIHSRRAISGGQNPSNGFWARKTTHPRGTKSGAQNPEGKIPATDLELGKSVTHLNNIEDSQTQALFRKFILLLRSFETPVLRDTSILESNLRHNLKYNRKVKIPDPSRAINIRSRPRRYA